MVELFREWFYEEYRGNRLRTIETYLTIFMFGSLFGWVYEEIFYFFAGGCQFVMRGDYFGPWLPVYGVDGVFMSLLIDRFRDRPLLVFLSAATICGLLEYITGYFIYNYMGGQRLWDYNIEPLNFGNINGYICLRSVVFFGLTGLFLIYMVAPTARHFAMCLQPKKFALIAFIPAAMFVAGVILRIILIKT